MLWDDNDHITAPGLRSLEGLKRIWTDPSATKQYYPLTHTVFWLAYRLWGQTFCCYHLLNISLHALSALLLVGVLRRLKVPGAWLGTMLFALHPVVVESVAWISELKNALSAPFFLGSVLVYLRFDRERNWKSYGLALGLFLLGLLSKTSIVSLPVVLVVLCWWQRGKLDWKRDVVPLVPFFLVGFVAGLTTAWVERRYIGAVGEDYAFTFIERCLIAGRAFWFYLGKLLWPANLMFIYPRWSVSQSVWWQYLFPLAAAALVAVLWALRRRWRTPWAVTICYLAALFPALGFFNVYPFRFSFVADHFQYLACLGPLVMAGAWLSRFGTKAGRNPIMVFGGLLVATLGLLSFRQASIYSDLETLWTATLARNPRCWLAYEHLAGIRAAQGRLDEAISLVTKSLEINPRNLVDRYDLGEFLRCANRLDEAVAQLQKALEIKPDDPNVHYTLGVVRFMQGRSDLAIEHFKQSLKSMPARADTHNNLGAAYLEVRRVDLAVAEWREALRLDRECLLAENNLAWVLSTSADDSLRNGPEALALATQANRLTQGKDPMVLRNLAAAYAENRRFAEAIETANQAMALAAPSLASELQKQLKSYQAGLPFREGGQVDRSPASSVP